MNQFKLGDSTAFGNSDNVVEGNSGANFWGHNIFKFDGSLSDKEKLLKVVKSYIKILTGKSIPVKYAIKDKDTSYTNGKSITISGEIHPTSLDSTIGLGFHEACHILLTDFKIFKNLVKGKGIAPKYIKHVGYIKNLCNWVEDRRIDWWAYNKNPGLQHFYEELYARYFYTEKVVTIIDNKGLIFRKETKQNYLFYIINSLNPHIKMNELEGLPEIQKIIDIENVDRFKSTKDALDCALKIFDVIDKYTDDNNIPKITLAGMDDEDETNGNGSDAEVEEDENLKQEEPENKLTEDEIEELAEVLGKAIEEALEEQEAFLDGQEEKEGLDEDEADLLEVITQDGTAVESINGGKNKLGKNQLVSVITIEKVDLELIQSKLYSIFEMKPNKINQLNIQKGLTLGRTLGKKIKVRNDVRTTKTVNLKKGKIDKRSLHRAGFGATDIFCKYSEEKYEDISIHISVDISASMGGEKWNNTLTSTVAICKAASTISGIRVQLSYRFTTRALGKETAVAMNFYDSKFDRINKLNLLAHVTPNGLTPEGLCFEALKLNIMKPLLNKNTLFINFSDGAPFMSSISSEEASQITRDVIKEFKNYGITILSYFITEKVSYYSDEDDRSNFTYMYGKESSEFLDVDSLVNLAKTINKKLLTLGK